MTLTNYFDRYVITQAVILFAIVLAALFTRQTHLYMQIIGVILTIIGAGILIIAMKNLGDSLAAVVSPKKEAHLVTSGMYGIVRHPIYTGIILLAIGWSIFWGSILSLLFSIILMVFFDIKSRKEEQLLIEKYPDYTQYKMRVRKKMIPFIY